MLGEKDVNGYMMYRVGGEFRDWVLWNLSWKRGLPKLLFIRVRKSWKGNGLPRSSLVRGKAPKERKKWRSS